MKEGKDTFCCFIDFQKAFDRVDRSCLFESLLNVGVTGKLYWAIKSCYQDTTCRVRVNGYVTESFENNAGVKQGDPLSATLINVFLNALAVELKEIGLGINFHGVSLVIFLYADDIVIFADNDMIFKK